MSVMLLYKKTETIFGKNVFKVYMDFFCFTEMESFISNCAPSQQWANKTFHFIFQDMPGMLRMFSLLLRPCQSCNAINT